MRTGTSSTWDAAVAAVQQIIAPIEQAVAARNRRNNRIHRVAAAYVFGFWTPSRVDPVRREAPPDELWARLDQLRGLVEAAPSIMEEAVKADLAPVRRREQERLAGEARDRQETLGREVGRVRRELQRIEADLPLPARSWDAGGWRTPVPATAIASSIRLGEYQAALPQSVSRAGSAGSILAPALVRFPCTGGLAIAAPAPYRARAAALARAVMLRLLAAVPPGSMRFVLVDPVALGQSVAEFMHLGDFDPLLVDTKPWTSESDIERRLDELALHLETVISKYLRGQFSSIDAYNAVAGEVAEPYRILVVFDFPAGFTERSARQLLSIIENGPRCGVHTVLLHDPAREPSRDLTSERLLQSMQRLTWDGDVARLVHPTAIGPVPFGLRADSAPPITFDHSGKAVTPPAHLIEAVGQRARAADSGPVTFARLLPVLNRLLAAGRADRLPDLPPNAPAIDLADPATWWTASSIEGVAAPIGRAGAQDVASLFFSSTEVAGGAIVVGLPRSGKSTALHAAVVSMCTLYGPDELELYLVDAKHGVEFKVYEDLPHARMVSINSDREFAVAVLRSLDGEIQRRAELMKARTAGRSNLAEYRSATGDVLPRVVVILDEFQEIFEEDDALGRAAFQAFSNIVRQGPFAGVHLVLSSQTLSDMPAMDRATLLLLPARVAFMSNESDTDIVMGDK